MERRLIERTGSSYCEDSTIYEPKCSRKVIIKINEIIQPAKTKLQKQD